MLTPQNILINPTPGSSHIAPRSLIINQLTYKTSQYLSNGLIRIISCNIKKDSLYVHMQLGSESLRNLWYDVVFEFPKFRRIDKDKVFNGISIKNSEMKVFSNSPEFIFTYAYSFNQKGYLIPEYKKYLGAEGISIPPKKKNPTEEIGMSTSLFICLKYLEMSGFFGNFNYLRFVNNVNSKPQSFAYIQKRMKELKKIK